MDVASAAAVLVSYLVAATGTIVRVSKTGTGDAFADSAALAGLLAIEAGEPPAGATLFALAAAAVCAGGWGMTGAAGAVLAGAAAYVWIVEVTVLVMVEIDSVVIVLVPIVWVTGQVVVVV